MFQLNFYFSVEGLADKETNMVNCLSQIESGMTVSKNLKGCPRTRFAFFWMNVASEPLVALYSLIPFLLRKDLDASLFQIALFVSLRPVLSVFSFYWSAYLKEGKGRLISNLISASFLAFFPFLFFPFFGNFWFLLFASATYQLFSKAAIPSLIEVLKRNLPKRQRENVYSLYFLLSFVESGLLGILFGKILDGHVLPWGTLFFFAALLGLSTIVLFSRLYVPQQEEESKSTPRSLTQPIKESFRLMRNNADFASFQKAFMIGGSALMLMAPALAVYYADTLKLTYSNITTARFIFMAIGVAGSTFFWRKGLSEIPLLRLTTWVLLGFGLFPIALLFSQLHLWFLYFAFFLYGVAQAGSHLIWNLSGTFFAGDNDSSPYTRVNILMLGIRGAIVPLVGGLLCEIVGPVPVLVMGMSLCLWGARHLRRAFSVATS